MCGRRHDSSCLDGRALGLRRATYCKSPAAKLEFKARELCPERTGEQGHPRLVAGLDQSLHVVWDEGPALAADAHAGHDGTSASAALKSGAGRVIVHASSRDGGQTFTSGRAGLLRAEAFQSQPALAVQADGRLFFAWAELTGDGKRMVFATAKP